MGRFGADTSDDYHAPPSRKQKRARVRSVTTTTTGFVARDRESHDGQPITTVKTLVRDAILDEPNITVAALQTLMFEQGVIVSIVALSVMRGEFRSVLRYLASRGKLKNIEL
jgi:hypothetical protein